MADGDVVCNLQYLPTINHPFQIHDDASKIQEQEKLEAYCESNNDQSRGTEVYFVAPCK